MAKKIGPRNLSVFGNKIRTTSAVESYNAVLAKIIPKKGNFFKFVGQLQMEEDRKSRELELVINSGGALGKPKRKTKENVVRANLIAKAETDLFNGIITATSFLDRMVFSGKKIVTDMEPFEDIFEGLEYMEEESEVEEESNATEEGAANPPLICIILTAHLK
ncbi:uncharacterized protein LOC126755821 [Bactrocera neohumeralis]|uniref:uncharacterized protein LOC126755821 n=1 Tax=Bactrocera neohumeralis TaxID=98809 RepID=UPI002165B793|nr:uncharacterized protein LOC126755821 [Bactrocera neohumeralis]